MTVNMGFTLIDANGRTLTDASATGGSFSGADVRSAAARLVEEQADEVVAKLYSDYCNKAEIGGPQRRK